MSVSLRSRSSFWIALSFVLAALTVVDSRLALADECDALLPEDLAKRVFFAKQDNRSKVERALNAVGFTTQNSAPGFALVAGVSRYPKLSSRPELQPAAEDMTKLANYLADVEHFDEIVVLANEDMNSRNLQLFFSDYFPCRLSKRKAQKPRFLFGYSGHGVTVNGSNGYFLTNKATSLSKKPRVDEGVDLRVLRAQFENIIESGYQTLALINACFSGHFIRQSFGERALPPQREGAFAITAGGADELTWHDASVGTGSVFFEYLWKALDGRIGDMNHGIVTVDELAAYLKRNIQLFSDDQQNPRPADLVNGGSPGGFFFLDRRKLVEQGVIEQWDPKTSSMRTPFGSSAFQGLTKEEFEEMEKLFEGVEYIPMNEGRDATMRGPANVEDPVANDVTGRLPPPQNAGGQLPPPQN